MLCLPSPSDLYLHDLFLTLQSLPNDSHLIILGDFNFPDINWSTLTAASPLSSSFCDKLFSMNLIQHVNESTHLHGNILDLILSNDLNLFDNISVDSAICSAKSDHHLISFNILSHHSSISSKRSRIVFNYHKADAEALNDYLFGIDLSSTPNFVMWNMFGHI